MTSGDAQTEIPRTVVDLLEPRDGLPAVTSTSQDLAAAVERLTAGTGPVAVDAERASGYRYGQKAYLVQLWREGAGTVLIDPVACPDLSGLDAALAGTEAVLHAASQDLPCLAEIGYRPRRLFDTELAGRLLGYPRVALGTMLEEVLGYRLAKEHSAADWSVRPLPEEMLRYAALDVEVLVELRDALAVQLAEQGKTEWARQEFAAIASAAPPPPRPDPWRRTSGIHKVRNRRGLAVVRELWEVRDGIAREADLSPRRVLADQAIVEAARQLPDSRPQLDKISGFLARNARRSGAQWLAAVRRARELPDSELPEVTGTGLVVGPPPAHRWSERDPAAAARLTAARETVAALAAAHRLPIENLLAPDAVRRLSWEPPDPATTDAIAATLVGYGARPWQAELTAGPLAAALADASLEADTAPGADGAAGADSALGGDNALGGNGAPRADHAPGAHGALGADHAPGAHGALGADHAPGAHGALGADHAPGAHGALGADHAPGAHGALGADHAPGAHGALGADHAPGADSAPEQTR